MAYALEVDRVERNRWTELGGMSGQSSPKYALTALEQEEAAKKALLMGAEGYMVKPFEQDALLFTIREFLK